MLAPLTFERFAASFFVALALAALATEVPRRRRIQASILSAAMAVGVLLAGQTGADLRVWLGHAYLVAGYWIPALLIPSHRYAHFESWLRRVDDRMRKFAIELPTWIDAVLEVSYLLCLVLVPVAFVFVWRHGTIAHVDRFWTVVLLSGFACYGSLPWLVSRPPRLFDLQNSTSAGVRHFNDVVLARVSHGFNTFPSGHVAVSLAAALQVAALSIPAGSVFLLIVFAIAAGAVAGRYHYALDVVSGAVLSIVVSLLV